MNINKILKTLFIVSFIFIPLSKIQAETLAQRLSGRILLQVEQHGEAWFVSMENQKRYYLGRPSDAFQVMRELGLGISNNDFNRFEHSMPEKLLGKILLKVEDSGKAFYVFPIDKKAYFLGRPSDAFNVMREFGLGITDLSLSQIEEDASSKARRQEQAQNQNIQETEGTDTATESNGNSQSTSTEETASSTDDKDHTATSSEEVASSTDETLSGSSACEFKAEYFKNSTISGAASYSETVKGIDFNWGAGGPETLGNYNNKFSARYTGDCYFKAGTYKFSSYFNDGIEATLDNLWLAKSWKDRNLLGTETRILPITEGYHKIKINYYDNVGDAAIGLDWMLTEEATQ